MAMHTNPIRRRLAEAFAFSKKELKGSSSPDLRSLCISSEAPNPAAEPEIRRNDIICPRKEHNA